MLNLKNINTSFVFLIIFSFTFCYDAAAQYNISEAETQTVFPFYFKRTPSTRSEAMGRTFMSSSPTAESIFFNPAGLNDVKIYSIFSSYSSGYYRLDDAIFKNLSAAFRIDKYGVLAFGFSNYKYGDYDNNLYFLNNPTMYSRSIFSYAGNIKSILKFGFSRNQISTENNVIKTENTSTYDFGSSLKIMDTEIDWFGGTYFDTNLIVGAQLSNIFNKKISANPNLNLPRNYAVGLKLTLNSQGYYNYKSLDKFFITGTVDYFNNSENSNYTGFRQGIEIVYNEIFALRGGHYSQKATFEIIDAKDIYGNDVLLEIKTKWSEFSFGIGLNLPIYKLTDGKHNYDLAIDFIHNNHAIPKPLGENLGNYNSISISLSKTIN